MHAALAFALGLTAVVSGPGHAQDQAVGEARCWIGSSTFSAGASMYVGDSIATCAAASGWKASEATVSAAGCLLDGKLSSAGALVDLRNSDSLLLECAAGGRWVKVEQEPKTQ